MKLAGLPLLLFVGLVIVLSVGLTLNPKHVPSPLIGKPAPALDLRYLDGSQSEFDSRRVKDKVWILNVWASWCDSCRAEHRQIRRLKEQRAVVLVGFNYKDEPEAARAWLRQHGNPYDYTLRDGEGETGLEWGVYAVPETFVIDQKGVIRYKHVGPVKAEDIRETILPLLGRLQGEKT